MLKHSISLRHLWALAPMIGLAALHTGCAANTAPEPAEGVSQVIDEEVGVAEEALNACDTNWTFQYSRDAGVCPHPGAPFCAAHCASTGCAVKYDIVSCSDLPPYAPKFTKLHSFTEYCGCKAAGAPTCTDGIQNQGEGGVDCGGPCAPCVTCTDGIQNQGETDVDCGGPCGACFDWFACFDGILNNGETEVDCGGQCGPCGFTPLVLSFDGGSVDYLTDATRSFDVSGMTSVVTDWPTARTPWLALDRDSNGTIDDGRELFGSLSPLPGGGRAENGFVALRALDANGDGQITAADPGFASLLVWSDRDGDRVSRAAELTSASTLEIVSIELDYGVARRCDAAHNCEVERAAFQFRDGAGILRTGAVIDVHLAARR